MIAEIDERNRRDRERSAALGVVLRTGRPAVDTRTTQQMLMSREEELQRIVEA
jgi:hypothetical protein